jgi:hypothetical protein
MLDVERAEDPGERNSGLQLFEADEDVLVTAL